MALKILEMDDDYTIEFAKSLINMKKNTHHCKICGNLTEDEICNICADEKRDKSIITVVEDIQGVVSLEVKTDHVYMHLIESAPFNIGKNKVYLGVPGNFLAFACKLSFQRGGEGYVSFLSKTKLIEHYERSLEAVHFGGNLMVITTETALKLTDKYFK